MDDLTINLNLTIIHLSPPPFRVSFQTSFINNICLYLQKIKTSTWPHFGFQRVTTIVKNKLIFILNRQSGIFESVFPRSRFYHTRKCSLYIYSSASYMLQMNYHASKLQWIKVYCIQTSFIRQATHSRDQLQTFLNCWTSKLEVRHIYSHSWLQTRHSGKIYECCHRFLVKK